MGSPRLSPLTRVTFSTDVAAIQDAVDAAGYSAVPMQDDVVAPEDDAERQARQSENQDLTSKVWVSGIISAVLAIGSLPAMMGLPIPFISLWLHNPWLQLVLTALVLFWAGRSFYINAWKALKRHTATMDTLVAIGTGAAYLYSLFPTFLPQWFISQGLKPDVLVMTSSFSAMKRLLYAATLTLMLTSLTPAARADESPREYPKATHLVHSGAHPNSVRTPNATHHFKHITQLGDALFSPLARKRIGQLPAG